MICTPVKLEPTVKDYLWGGRKLIDDFNKKTDCEIAAESWELSAHPDGESVVKTGVFSGMKFTEYIKKNGEECMGSRAAQFDFFPILIKLIDAKDNLSIQVHPADEYALEKEGQYGKSEVWYIVDCEEDSYLYYGLNREVSKDEFEKRIKDNTILEILNKVSVRKGDVFFIPPGTIHAIGAGLLICEVQQNSNVTYRVYDYDRRGADGKPRELHIEKAVEVTDMCPAPKQPSLRDGIISTCKYFTVEKIDCEETKQIKLDKESFRSLIILDGTGSIEIGNEILDFSKGDSVFIPAQDGSLFMKGEFEAILSYV